jgi:TIR domain
VRRIADLLEERGLLPWLDERELPPGQPWQQLLEKQIGSIRTAAVFVGAAGIGPWQQQELDGFLREFKKRNSPVIPVLLHDAPDNVELPIFLNAMTWVDFRLKDPDPLTRLIWGITRQRPRG